MELRVLRHADLQGACLSKFALVGLACISLSFVRNHRTLSHDAASSSNPRNSLQIPGVEVKPYTPFSKLVRPLSSFHPRGFSVQQRGFPALSECHMATCAPKQKEFECLGFDKMKGAGDEP